MTAGVETTPVSTTFEVPFERRSLRFCNIAELTRTRNRRFGLESLSPMQIDTLTTLSHQVSRYQLHPEEGTFENPTITVVTQGKREFPNQVEFGNSTSKATFFRHQLEELLDGLFGGKITDPGLLEAIQQVKEIQEALKSGKQVVLRFDR